MCVSYIPSVSHQREKYYLSLEQFAKMYNVPMTRFLRPALNFKHKPRTSPFPPQYTSVSRQSRCEAGPPYCRKVAAVEDDFETGVVMRCRALSEEHLSRTSNALVTEQSKRLVELRSEPRRQSLRDSLFLERKNKFGVVLDHE